MIAVLVPLRPAKILRVFPRFWTDAKIAGAMENPFSRLADEGQFPANASPYREVDFIARVFFAGFFENFFVYIKK